MLGGDVRIREFLSKLFHFLLALFVEIAGRGQLAPVNDIDCTLRPHDGNLGRRKSKVHVGSDMFAGHDVVSPPVGLARDDGDFRHRGFRKRVKQLRTVFDNSAELLICSR